MKFKSQVYTEASGSIGGVTYSRNRGGMYTRARAKPTNPNTPEQQIVRAIMASLTAAWVNDLTAGNRNSWDAYAAATPITNLLGEPVNVGGLGMFIRSNSPRLQSGFPRVDNYSGPNNLGGYTEPDWTTVVASEATQDISLPFDETDNWVDGDDNALILWASRPQNLSVNYFKGPYRQAGYIAGDSTTPPTSPVTIAAPFPFAAGQRLFLRVNVSRADGRLSTQSRNFTTTVA